MDENKLNEVEIPINFDDFSVGDYTYFEKSFNVEDFRIFEILSGDSNPLHSDEDYAKLTKYGKKILPVHLTISPFSAIAGMCFPGKPSLYLGHEIKALKPVYYHEKLIYSAKIKNINHSNRILTLRVLVIRNDDIVVDAEMSVQSLEQTWILNNSKFEIYSNHNKGYAIVSGATGEIGQAVSVKLAKFGWNLLLLDRGSENKRRVLRKKLESYDIKFEFLSTDFSNKHERIDLKNKITKSEHVYDLIVHTASSDVDSSIDALVATNYSALKDLIKATLPKFLLKQSGIIINVSSIYVAKNVIGWEDYTAAKTMAAGYINGINKHYSKYGIKAMSIYPGVVLTDFSKKYREETSALMPAEVAETILEMIDSDDSIALETNSKKPVKFGLNAYVTKEIDYDNRPRYESKIYNEEKMSVLSKTDDIKSGLLNLISRQLKLEDTENLINGGIDITPGWDSLAQIEIIIAIESKYGISFNSYEITDLKDFQSIYNKVLKEVQ